MQPGSMPCSHALPSPTVELVKQLGEGGFVEVWHGRYCGRDVAVKRLKTGREVAAHETQLLTECIHRRFVACFGRACPHHGIDVRQPL